jgi:hypothetical protein
MQVVVELEEDQIMVELQEQVVRVELVEQQLLQEQLTEVVVEVEECIRVHHKVMVVQV